MAGNAGLRGEKPGFKKIMMVGLIRGIRDLWRAYRTFGDTELEALKRQVLANRETLLRVKAIQDANSKLAEEEVLTAIREAVGEMRTLHDQAEADSKAAIRSLKELEGTVEREMARDERRRTVELLNNPDVAKLLQEAVDGGDGGDNTQSNGGGK